MLAAAAIALAAIAVEAPAAGPAARVEVVRDGDTWTAGYSFPKPSPVWVFTDSTEAREVKGSWRSGSWQVLTPGVRLERRGWYDVLVANEGDVPQRVTIRFTPFVKDIEAAYDAALAFTDGSVALYAGKFSLFPASSADEVETFAIHPGEIPAAAAMTRVTMSDHAGDVLLHGRRAREAVLDDGNSYVLFGRTDPVETTAMRALIDSNLPQWLGTYLGSAIPAVLDSYAAKMGPAPGEKPLLLVSWAGATADERSMGGSVLPSTIVMTFEGDAVTREDPALRNDARWFAAHEGAHFWLGQAVSYERPQDGWITEGGADLLAYRAVAATDPGFDVRGVLQKALDQCLASSRKGGVASANERGDHKAYYHCGATFGLVAERVSGGDFPAFVRGLIESNRDDGKVSRSEWLAALDARAPGKDLGKSIGALLDAPAADSKPWADLLAKAGIPHRVTPAGTIELQ